MNNYQNILKKIESYSQQKRKMTYRYNNKKNQPITKTKKVQPHKHNMNQLNTDSKREKPNIYTTNVQISKSSGLI